MLRGFDCENDVGFGNLAGALSGRLPGLECSGCKLTECCRVLAAQSTKSGLLRFQLELLSASPLPVLKVACSGYHVCVFGVSISKIQDDTTVTDANGQGSINSSRQRFRGLAIERFVPSSNALISIYAMVQRTAES